jgi:hypothetical protein
VINAVHVDKVLIGVDCATKDAKIGLALGEYRTGDVDVSKAQVCTRQRCAAVIITEWLRERRVPALLAIDVPLARVARVVESCIVVSSSGREHRYCTRRYVSPSYRSVHQKRAGANAFLRWSGSDCTHGSCSTAFARESSGAFRFTHSAGMASSQHNRGIGD